MRQCIEIEDIEFLRRQNGIHDVELQAEIKALNEGSIVRLTFLAGPRISATLAVRITSIVPAGFRGTLTEASSIAGLATLRIGGRVVFTADHIHSIVKASRNSKLRQ